MKKTSLFLVIAYGVRWVGRTGNGSVFGCDKSDTLKNAVDSLNVTAPVDSLQNAAQKKVVPASKEKGGTSPTGGAEFLAVDAEFPSGIQRAAGALG